MSLLSNTFGKAKQAATLGLATAAFAMPFNTWGGSSAANDTSWRTVQKFDAEQESRPILSVARDLSEDRPVFAVRASKDRLREAVSAAYDIQGRIAKISPDIKVLVIYQEVKGKGDGIAVITPFMNGRTYMADNSFKTTGALSPAGLYDACYEIAGAASVAYSPKVREIASLDRN